MSAQTVALATAVTNYATADPTLFNVLVYLDDVMDTLGDAIDDVSTRLTTAGAGALPSAASWGFAVQEYQSAPQRTLFDVLGRIALVAGATSDAIAELADAVDSLDGLGGITQAETLEDASMNYLGTSRTLFNVLAALAVYVAALAPALGQIDARLVNIEPGSAVSATDNGNATDGANGTVNDEEPDYTDRPFRADSPWNVVIPANATYYGAGDARTDQIRMTNKPPVPGWESGGSVAWGVNAQNYAINDFTAQPGDPTKTVRVKDIYGSRFDFNVTIPWPSGAHAALGTDMHLTIRDADKQTTHDFWLFDESTNPPTAASYSRTRLDGTGWNLFPYALESPSNPTGRNPDEAIAGVGAGRAVSVALLGGLITAEDVARGSIDHALALAVPRTYIRRGPRVPPADDTDSWYDGDGRSNGPLAYSMRFTLPRDLDIDTLPVSAEWKMVFRAVQKHGLLIVDVGGERTPCIYTAYPAAYSFGTTLRNTQETAFPQMVSRLMYVEMP